MAETLDQIGTTVSLNTNKRERILRFQFTTGVVAGSGVDSTELQIPIGAATFRLVAVKTSCASTNYVVSIRNQTLVTLPSINEFYRATAINQDHQADNINTDNTNRDSTQVNFIYMLITNNDNSNATGAIDIELELTSL